MPHKRGANQVAKNPAALRPSLPLISFMLIPPVNYAIGQLEVRPDFSDLSEHKKLVHRNLNTESSDKGSQRNWLVRFIPTHVRYTQASVLKPSI